MDRPSWQAPQGVHSFSTYQQGSSHTRSPSHPRPRASRVNVRPDSVQTSPPTAPRVHRQETAYPQLQDENHGNSVRPAVQYAQSGGINRRDSQKPSYGAAQPSRNERRKPLTDITKSANNNASQPTLPRSNTSTASAFSNNHSSIAQGTRFTARETSTTAQDVPRTFPQNPVVAENTPLPAEEGPIIPQEIPSRGISDKLVGLTAAYVNHRRSKLGEPRYAGNGQIADFSCLLITHPEVVGEWIADPAYSEDRITLLLQWYVQISQVYGPAMVYHILDRRHDNSPHMLDHRVALQSSGGTPLNGSIMYAGNMESTSGTQIQSDYIQGDPIFELVHYRRSWEQLPIGTTLTQILHHYPNHMKDEHIDAFEQQGVSGKTMSTGQPKVLRDLLVSIGVSEPDKPDNAMNKRLQYRKNDIVTRYGAAGWNSLINSPVKLRAVGPAVSFRQPKSVDRRFIPNPEDQIDYQNTVFPGPPTRRAVAEGYKRDKTADAQKKAARATKNSFSKSRKLVADFLPRWEPLRIRVNANSVVDPRLTQALNLIGTSDQVGKKRRHNKDDNDDEYPIHNNVFGPPPKRRRAAHGTFYPVGQSMPRQHHDHRHQSGYMPAQPRHDVPSNPGNVQSTTRSSHSNVSLFTDSDGTARLQRVSDNSYRPFQPPPTNSPQPSLAGQKRRRDDAEEQHNESITGELTQPAAKKLKQTAAASGIDVSSSDSQSTLSQAGKLGQQQEETLDDPGVHGWFDLGMGDQAAEFNQPDSFTEMLEDGLRGEDWASNFGPGSVPDVIEPLPLSSDNQHTNDDTSGQGPRLTPAVFESAAPSDGSHPAMARDNIETIYQQPPPRGLSPGPSKTSKRGRDEFEEDVQNSQEPSAGRPLKKLKQTTASSKEMAADTTHASQDSQSVNGGGSGRVERNSMPQIVQQVEPSVQTAGDSQLNVSNDPFSLTSIEGTTDNSLAFLGDLDHSDPYNSAGDLYALGGSSSSAPFLADDTAGADFEAEFEAMFGAPSGPELDDAAGQQVDSWPR